jgi:hypothetical protein
VAPLKNQGSLVSDSKANAEILIDQFRSVFTRNTDTILPPDPGNVKHDISVTNEGVVKLLQNINPAKACGPDAIPNKLLKECATEVPPVCPVPPSLSNCSRCSCLVSAPPPCVIVHVFVRPVRLTPVPRVLGAAWLLASCYPTSRWPS